MAETRSRSDVIADYIGTTIDDILDEYPYWKMAPGDNEPLWFEIRDAIIAKVFAVEREDAARMYRLLHSGVDCELPK